jgi:hypothetical protein
MSTLLVGLGNKARHGKDTVASYIVQRMPESARIFSFADDLKALARALGMTEKNGPFLQQLGVAMRTLDPDYWVGALGLRIHELKPAVAIIPDMRFPNEKAWIEMNGGLTARITRTSIDGSLWVADDRDPKHESEIALDGALFDRDFVIRSGDFGALQAAADNIVAAIRARL